MRYPEKPTINQMIAILHDQPYSVSRDITRDINTFIRRSSHEGLSFLTKTLPRLGKAIDTALSGNVTFKLPQGFKSHRKSCIPQFLGSALRRIFSESGHLLQVPCVSTIKWIRTFCYFVYKLEVPFDEESTQEFCLSFIATDDSIGNFPAVSPDNVRVRSRMRSLLSTINVEPVSASDGPGVSSDCSRSQKANRFVPPSPMRNAFGREVFHLTAEHWDYELFCLFFSAVLSAFFLVRLSFFEGFSPSKILFVPKDSRGPRTICCEDSRLMKAQKSLQKELYSHIERNPNFSGRVNFTDQTINQRLTFDPCNATLDLKDASDRVSLDLITDVFPEKLSELLIASRSTFYELPDGSVHPMKKFAPMGSALCFPIMALVAYTSVCAAISIYDESWDMWDQRDVFVYGDDIIVPNKYAEYAISGLESVGLIVNKTKSFINSRFRESCGQDTFDQSTVTPIRKKKEFKQLVTATHNGRRVFDNGEPIVHHCELMNRARRAGYFNLANCIENQLVLLIGPVPYGHTNSPYVCKHVDEKDVSRFNKAEGLEVNGNLRAYALKDRELKIKFSSPYTRLRLNLLNINGFEPIDVTKLGARNTYLQFTTYVRYGYTYRPKSRRDSFEKNLLP